jgi:hypothetical protein
VSISCAVRCRHRRRARGGGLRHLRRHHGAPGAAVRALHRQLQLRPARGRVHRVSTKTASFLPAAFLLAVTDNCSCNAGIFSRLVTPSSSSIAGEFF